ncbi:pilus assembly FimT family protein [Alteromonas sp. D210916BOD_24]|uniref:pilus assembly FimT family protein n=1 Tax=Alteromonas sp. D210916BOD_24 TaxID=3157618 RepID=UPI00399C74D6
MVLVTNTNNNTKRNLTRSRCFLGYSLLELMLAISLFTLLTAFAAPSFVTYREQVHFLQAVDNIAQLAKTARTLALTLQQPMYFIVNIHNDSCVALSEYEYCDCNTLNSCASDHVLQPRAQLSDDIWLSTTQNHNTKVIFNSLGAVHFGSSTTLTVSSSQYNAKVTISSLGRVKACSQQILRGIARC